MDQYEAIFLRQSVRKYRMEAIDPDTLGKIASFYKEIPALFPGIETEIGITENTAGRHILRGWFGVNAPYYLSFYSKTQERYQMNAGYICEQLSLYLMTLGLGSCFLGGTSLRNAPASRDGKKFVILMAFGKPDGPLTRRAKDAKRRPVSALCTFKDQPEKWMMQVVEAARLAPSDMNSQPWRFYSSGDKLHVFSRKPGMDKPEKWEEFDFGVMFAHIAVASDELWLDVDLIRLENIVQKSFKSSQYVLSAIIRGSEAEPSEKDAAGEKDADAAEKDKVTEEKDTGDAQKDTAPMEKGTGTAGEGGDTGEKDADS